ncbi:hypothetical protein R5R35_014442 [Gryllus longicercus]|uniref:SAM domain-containing protein n=1 Tax=Gryllus longicercus TaxID=2509291 RepID=A0AAN9V4I3_9ORTH
MGKSASKLKKKRSQSIAWSFRFPSLGSLSRPRRMAPPVPPPPAAAKPHLDVRQWLAVLDLQQYAPNFERFTGVEELLCFSEEDIRSLGVRNSAHRARVVSSLVALRSKYDKGNAKRKEKPQRHSVAVDSQQAGASEWNVSSETIIFHADRSSIFLFHLHTICIHPNCIRAVKAKREDNSSECQNIERPFRC